MALVPYAVIVCLQAGSNTCSVFAGWISVQRGKVGLSMSAATSEVVSQIADSDTDLGSGLKMKPSLL